MRRGFLHTVGVVGVVVAGALLPAATAAASDDPALPWHRDIRFPVEGPARFRPDFGEPRDGGARAHQGVDVFAPKGTPVVAAVAGTVVTVGTGASRAGHWVTVRSDDGWRWLYLHLNDDTPGTDDGAAPPSLTFGPGVRVGVRVAAGQVLGYVGDSGNAEDEAPQLHFEVRTPANVPLDPWTSLRLASGRDPATTCTPDTDPSARPDAAASGGVWLAAADGGVFALGGAPFLGSVGDLALRSPVVGMAALPASAGAGYWLVAADGGVFAFGDAPFLGSTGDLRLHRPVVGMVATPTGRGYWLVAADGGVFAFGDAPFVGSLGDLVLNRPVVGMAPAGRGTGYWLVASDGGVFAFGDAPFAGAWPDAPAPVRAIAGAPGGAGYLLASADGAVAARGSARRPGSLQSSGRCAWPSVVGIAPSRTGSGAWVAGRDGSLVALGDAPDVGDLPRLGVAGAAVVAVVAVP